MAAKQIQEIISIESVPELSRLIIANFLLLRHGEENSREDDDAICVDKVYLYANELLTLCCGMDIMTPHVRHMESGYYDIGCFC